ncbi:MAG TPA: phytanoyl-CoA dioxygenase family protein [Phenylobacterium sp.]|jgi:ectoine hydroxylase-related dioxygenase (phytanoyl-CoA dioxygenase family)|nr:phytanoyl-CoA dioxygenase family protein [Phenylobacterium sp.]
MKDTRDVFTPALAETYARDGAVRLPGAIPAADIEAMRAALERKLAARPQRTPRPSKLSSRSGEFDAFASPAVRTILNTLLGEWEEPDHWGLPLVSFHTGEAVWNVPRAHWHIDLGAPRAGQTRLVRLFAFLTPSRPGGGGTGYVAGSHRLIEALFAETGRTLPSAQARRRLEARSPWFATLSSHHDEGERIERFMQDGDELDGVRVRVCEMLGEPGDVILMHPLMLHAPTPNVLATPRMMLTQFVYGSG